MCVGSQLSAAGVVPEGLVKFACSCAATLADLLKKHPVEVAPHPDGKDMWETLVGAAHVLSCLSLVLIIGARRDTGE